MFDIFNPLATQQNAFSLAEAAILAGYSSPVAAGVDWNTITTRGLYRVDAPGVNSAAINTWAPSYPGLLKVEVSNNVLLQTYISLGGKEVLIRTTELNGLFTRWRLIASADKPSITIFNSETRATSGGFRNFSKVVNSMGLSGFDQVNGSFTAPFTGLYSYELAFATVATPAEGYVQVGGFNQSFTGTMQYLNVYRTEYMNAEANQLQNFSCIITAGSIRLSIGKITFLG